MKQKHMLVTCVVLLLSLLVSVAASAAVLNMGVSEDETDTATINQTTTDVVTTGAVVDQLQASGDETEEEETVVTPEPTTVAQEEFVPSYGVTNKKGVNLRQRPNSRSTILLTIGKTGTQVTVTDEATDGDGKRWYKVEASKKKGYILAELITLEGEELPVVASADGGEGGTSAASTVGSPAGNAPAIVASSSSMELDPSAVWVNSGGSVYHQTYTCKELRNPYAIKLDEAKSGGMTACAECW